MSVINAVAPLAVKLDPTRLSQCEQLAEQLHLPIVHNDCAAEYAYVLVYSELGLAIQQTGSKAAGPVLVDFITGATDHRRKHGGAELIVKAVGGNKSQLPTVLDTTAGLGRDSFVLASRNYSVTLCERSPLIAAVLEDGLMRAACHGDVELQQIVGRMQLKKIDAMSYLQGEEKSTPPDVIVIDPMFPDSKKSALVKKEMRTFHQLVGADADSDQLLALALKTAKYRVVVKRPKKAAWLGGVKPNFCVEGKAIRFDVYSLKAYSK